jgi:cardiolipin synthase
MADQAFSRAAGAPLVQGNAVRILEDGKENYPAWLEAIAAARETVHFECYIVHDDEVGKATRTRTLSRIPLGRLGVESDQVVPARA